MFNFLIGDFISRINVAKNSHMKSIIIKSSKMVFILLKIFEDLGLIRGYTVINDTDIEVYLRYNQSRSPFHRIKLVSKPSKRVYVDVVKLVKMKEKFYGEILILSTKDGVLIDIDCITRNIGGEVLLRIVI